MLHFETIEPATLELLRTLQDSTLLKDCRLVGGTSLALQIGHRKSFYEAKYPNASSFMALKSLSYFEDAEIQPMPYMFSPLSWEETKAKVLQAINAIGQS